MLTVLPAICAFSGSGCSRADLRESSAFSTLKPGVSLRLANERAETLSDVSYEIFLSVPESSTERISGRETIRFRSRAPDRPVVIDFKQPPESILSVRSEGKDLDFVAAREHILVHPRMRSDTSTEVTIDFVAGDSSLNRNPGFLYTLFVPDRAREALPCFDQPNLKASFTLTLEVPKDWNAVTNTAAQGTSESAGRTTYRFAPTKPISTYLFGFAAGRFYVETANRRGRQLRLFHRENDAAKVARNREAIFDMHARSLAWLQEYTGIPYPFEKLDFVLIPSFQYGGMEHPGAIFYRASQLFLEATATQNDLLRRATLIAHETAHMWFGNLVTMRWFNDVWTKEVFANFFAAKIIQPLFPKLNHKLRFLLEHYPRAYSVDRSDGSNAIRQPLVNLHLAGTLYGAVIYYKAPIVIDHLERLMGDAALRRGMRRYLKTHRFGNASWDDLITILDDLTEEDLTAWSGAWVEQSGRPTVTAQLEVAGGRITALRLQQRDPAHRGRTWTQDLTLLLHSEGNADRIPVRLRGTTLDVKAAVGKSAPEFLLINGAGSGYGRFPLDPRSRSFLLHRFQDIKDPLVRGIAWLALWEDLLHGAVPPAAFLENAIRAVQQETDELNTSRFLDDTVSCYWRFLSGRKRNQWAPRLESLCWERLEKAQRPTLKSLFFRTFRTLALSESAVRRLHEVWSGARTVEGLTFSERDTTAMAFELAVRLQDPVAVRAILARQLARIENPDRRRRFAFISPALSADRDVRRGFFHSLANAEHREHEPWVIEALLYLHHPLRARSALEFITPSLELLEEIQRTGDVFFPKSWLDATLRGHSSIAAAELVDEFLRQREDLPPNLRRKVLQSADELFRAARMVK